MYKFYWKAFVKNAIMGASEFLSGWFLFGYIITEIERGTVLGKGWATVIDIVCLLLGWLCIKIGARYICRTLSTALGYLVYLYKHYKLEKHARKVYNK